MKNTLNLLEELHDGNAPAGSPEEGVPLLFRATPRPRSNGRAVRSKANRERWQGILETTRRTSRRYEPRPRVHITSSFRAICARMSEAFESLPLPEHPLLAAWASALNDVGYWANLLDAEWRFVFLTDELLLSYRDMGATTIPHIGAHFLSAEARQFLAETVPGAWVSSWEARRAWFLKAGRYMLAGTPSGREKLRRVVDPELADLVDQLQPQDLPPVWINRSEFTTAGAEVTGSAVWIRIDDAHGRRVGVCILPKPAAGMSHLARAAATADLTHLERMRVVARPDRHPAAILMADLEASSPLARHLSTAQFFAFGRRLIRAADRCIIDAGGIVGPHAGDGVVAFFLAETTGSESAAARGCITAARNLRDLLPDIVARSELSDAEVSLRFGLHWGATLYMGRILTAGRSEVTALGDEANEAARVEACATGGKTLASKSLIERLNHSDADALGLDTGHTKYTLLADLSTATDKARRDAPSIAVCEI
jgi:class 3 adenylate cyclase